MQPSLCHTRVWYCTTSGCVAPNSVSRSSDTEVSGAWLHLQLCYQPCRDLAAAAVALHPMVVRYDPGVVLTAMLRRPVRFARFMAVKPPLLEDEVRSSSNTDATVRLPALLLA